MTLSFNPLATNIGLGGTYLTPPPGNPDTPTPLLITPDTADSATSLGPGFRDSNSLIYNDDFWQMQNEMIKQALGLKPLPGPPGSSSVDAPPSAAGTTLSETA